MSAPLPLEAAGTCNWLMGWFWRYVWFVTEPLPKLGAALVAWELNCKAVSSPA